MTREEFISQKIKALGTVKDFSIKINMPYTTLRSIMCNVGGASIDNIFKICRGLNIHADDLTPYADYPPREKICPLACTDSEKDLIKKYRCLSPEGKATVDAVVDIQYQAALPRVKNGGEIS